MYVEQSQQIAKEINQETPEDISAVADGETLIIESKYSEHRIFRTDDVSEALFLISFMFASKEAGVENALQHFDIL